MYLASADRGLRGKERGWRYCRALAAGIVLAAVGLQGADAVMAKDRPAVVGLTVLVRLEPDVGLLVEAAWRDKRSLHATDCWV